MIKEKYVGSVHHQHIVVMAVLKANSETVNGTVFRGRLFPNLYVPLNGSRQFEITEYRLKNESYMKLNTTYQNEVAVIFK